MEISTPIRKKLVSIVLVTLIFVAQYLVHVMPGRLNELTTAYARLPMTVPMVFGVALVGILALRAAGQSRGSAPAI